MHMSVCGLLFSKLNFKDKFQISAQEKDGCQEGGAMDLDWKLRFMTLNGAHWDHA